MLAGGPFQSPPPISGTVSQHISHQHHPSLTVFRQRLNTFLFRRSYPDLIIWHSGFTLCCEPSSNVVIQATLKSSGSEAQRVGPAIEKERFPKHAAANTLNRQLTLIHLNFEIGFKNNGKINRDFWNVCTCTCWLTYSFPLNCILHKRHL